MAKRTDANQTEIVKKFRELGFSVLIMSDLGKGAPDIVVGAFGSNYLIEIKDGKKPPSARKLTPHEKMFHDTWRGQVDIISSPDEVSKFLERAVKGVAEQV